MTRTGTATSVRDSLPWSIGLNPQGGGLFVRSPDGRVYFRLYGYAQPTVTLTDARNRQAYHTLDFRVRRSRIDFSVDYDDRYKLFIEIDGAVGDGTALVESYAQAVYARGQFGSHTVRLGKFITPFSTENLRSSRALETVERFLALNAMFGLPALDVQFGPMFFGTVGTGDRRLSYYAAALNGNASAGAAVVNGTRGNARDNNGFKDVQLRLDAQLSQPVKVGIAFDADHEEGQALALTSYSGASFVSIPVRGRRRGLDVDASWRLTPRVVVSTEALGARFTESDAELRGGYAQLTAWTTGSERDGGVQLVLRAEASELRGAAVDNLDGKQMTAVTTGANVWLNGATRVQINAIAEHTSGAGNGVLTERAWRPTVLTQFQIKF